ncbi:hypothetical protein JOC78_001311 [Bacillus ectoiniformans]|uniref:YwmB family TATA-box binding protein n=1 Tax=Bacillus ectoiniformans TaxID=1494429 RepID=UPI001956D38C|nr:YwmB family TATA-box binding protein [Bacillus ectoiniformans]MBM7648369.1 hypothetical protein [Bacillus ectoiniformans]
MKKILTILIVFSFILVNYGNSTIAQDQTGLLQMTDEVKKQEGKINEWMIHTREKTSREQMNDVIRKIKTLFPNWEYSDVQKSKKDRLVAVHSNGHIQQQIKLSYDSDYQAAAYLIYTVKITDESALRKFMDEQFDQTYSQIFNNTPPIFTCIQGEFGGKLEEVLQNQISTLLLVWKAKKIEDISESGFYSLSAFSERFKETLPLPSQQMNLQIGLRETGLGAGTNFVIGTPIITIEY